MNTYTLQVPSMHCNGCIKTIRHALTEVDAQVQMQADLEQHQLNVTTEKSREQIVNAILDAGHQVN